MVIMFLLGATSTAGAVGSTYAAVYHVLDGCHRLRLDRLKARAKRTGVNGALTEAALAVGLTVRNAPLLDLCKWELQADSVSICCSRMAGESCLLACMLQH
jgi:hypothetical protein